MSREGKRPDEREDSPPPRLRDDPMSSARVRQDLSNATGAAPNYDAAAGLLALQAVLGTTAKIAAAGSAAASTAASTASTATKSALAFKLTVAGGISAVALGGAVLLSSPSRDVPPPAQRALTSQHAAPVVHAPAPDAPAPDAPDAPDAPAPDAPAPAVPAAVVVEPQVPPQAHRAAQVSHGPRDHAAAEIAQLAQIKALVETAPSRALRLAEQGHRQFSEGYLHHEREGLAIIALHALGRRDEARARAQRYLARYPHSSLSDRVRALGEDVSEP